MEKKRGIVAEMIARLRLMRQAQGLGPIRLPAAPSPFAIVGPASSAPTWLRTRGKVLDSLIFSYAPQPYRGARQP